jgi:hypothetical protein
MTAGAEKFRQQIQKELGLTVGPKDPLLALWVAQQEFLKEIGAELSGCWWPSKRRFARMMRCG